MEISQTAALQDQMKSLFMAAAHAMFGLDGTGNILCINPAACSLFGHTEASLLGKPISICVPGLTEKALFEMFGDETSYYHGMDHIERLDLFGTRAQQALFPVEMTLGNTHNAEGIAYVCTVRDVTDARAAVSFTELYERALACSHNAVFIVNAAQQSLPLDYVNDALISICGQPMHHLLGHPLETLLGTFISAEAIAGMLQDLHHGQHTQVTARHDMPEAGEKVFEVSISPVHGDHGRLTHFIGIILDVSARLEAERAAAERSAQLNAVFSLSPDGFVMFDAFDKLVFANPSFEQMLGMDRQALGQMTLAQFEDQLLSLCDESVPLPVMRGEQPNASWVEKMHLVRPQHRVVQVRAMRNEAGRSETIMYFRDITHEDTVDRMKSEFLASAAHELRTPMVSIFGFTELLLRRKYTDTRRDDMLQTIHRQSGLLVKMINELLDLARIEARQGLDMRVDVHPMAELVQNSVNGLMRAENERQVVLGDIPPISLLIDIEKMQLAMTNLLSNAFKYSPQGGTVSLSVETQQVDGAEFAVVSIIDQGIGMTPEQVARAFERFYRADSSGNIPGTGLGLSLVHEIAGLHNGKVELSSEYERGTTAKLWIPLAPQIN